MNSRVIVPVIAILAIVQLFAQPGYAITCGEVDVALIPCIPYLTGHDIDPTPGCCNGLKVIIAKVQTPADKRACCNCVKAAANRYPDLKDAVAQSLPAKCGVAMDIVISRNVNCDKLESQV
ncbi:non-specific lipid-transfer protein 1-like [Primulina huaijiensis]|uniref:non-specific lipid-transfer protein 1-like n=1 Tax=Primulina huaijiensis TaxID=1492673 RepID=UPI003CC742DF